jgi:signal transduction histidine kinase
MNRNAEAKGRAVPCVVDALSAGTDRRKSASSQPRRGPDLTFQTEAILNALSDPACAMDLDGRIRCANLPLLREVGKTSGQVLGETLLSAGLLDDKEFLEVTHRAIPDVLSGGTPVTLEAGSRWPQGRALSAALTLGLLRDVQGSPRAWICSWRRTCLSADDQRECQEHGGQSLTMAELAALGAVTSSIVREMTQPLSVVRLTVQTALMEMETGKSPAAVGWGLEACLSASDAINAAITKIRAYARSSAGTNETEAYVGRAAEWATRVLAPSTEQAGVTIRLHSLDALPAVRMQPTSLQLLFFAVITHTLRMAEGGGDRQLSIRGVSDSGCVTIRFAHDCDEIDPQRLTLLFKPCSSGMTIDEGTPLELYLASQLVDHAGGRITIESRCGEGATFTVILPRDAAHTGGE